MTMNLTTLRALQSRIRECKGADRELDWLILSNVSQPWLADKARSWSDDQYVDIDGRISDSEEICWISREDGKRRYEHCPHWTTSPDGLGACVALMREVLPGLVWDKDFYVFRIYRVVAEGVWKLVEGADPLANDCLTFIDAIVSAKISELEATQKETA
jgi:hypothetical protein